MKMIDFRKGFVFKTGAANPRTANDQCHCIGQWRLAAGFSVLDVRFNQLAKFRPCPLTLLLWRASDNLTLSLKMGGCPCSPKAQDNWLPVCVHSLHHFIIETGMAIWNTFVVPTCTCMFELQAYEDYCLFQR